MCNPEFPHTFDSIKIGEVFIAPPLNHYHAKLYMPITVKDGFIYNAVNITTGELAFFVSDAPVHHGLMLNER